MALAVCVLCARARRSIDLVGRGAWTCAVTRRASDRLVEWAGAQVPVDTSTDRSPWIRGCSGIGVGSVSSTICCSALRPPLIWPHSWGLGCPWPPRGRRSSNYTGTHSGQDGWDCSSWASACTCCRLSGVPLVAPGLTHVIWIGLAASLVWRATAIDPRRYRWAFPVWYCGTYAVDHHPALFQSLT